MKKIKLWLEFIKLSKEFTQYSYIRIIFSFKEARSFIKSCYEWERAGNTNEERYLNTDRVFRD